jgi:hypothetical protein
VIYIRGKGDEPTYHRDACCHWIDNGGGSCSRQTSPGLHELRGFLIDDIAASGAFILWEYIYMPSNTHIRDFASSSLCVTPTARFLIFFLNSAPSSS